ncbi:hypothetical protein Y032_0011g1569 [Ancylostoma ceylanicum]|nr:hypothetical protein Y032_0011g1569 [Ancylostoma ceylanicum]
MTVLSFVTLPVNIFAMYCIIRKSTKQMGSYKWYLLAYQLSSFIFDFVFTVLILPMVFFPVPMGYADSTLARWTSLSSHASLIIFVSCFPFLTVTTISLFVYRCHLIIPQHHFLKINREGHVYISSVLLLIYCVPVGAGLVNVSPDQKDAKRWVLEEYSCAESVIDIPRLHIFTPSSVRPLGIIALAQGVFAAIVTAYTIWLSFRFLRETNNMSQKTKAMQRRYLIYLCVQVSIPLFSLLIPVLVLLYILGMSADLGQGTGNFALSCMGVHGSTTPLSLIFCNDNYRNFTLMKIRGCAGKKHEFNVSTSVEQRIVRSAIQ